MAKKSRRARRPIPAPAQPVRIVQPVRTPVTRTPVREVDFAREYHYVVEDLKRIAIIALCLLVLLIVLAVIIG